MFGPPSTPPTIRQGVLGTFLLLVLAALPLWWSTDEVETGNRFVLWGAAALLLGLAVWRGVSTGRQARTRHRP